MRVFNEPESPWVIAESTTCYLRVFYTRREAKKAEEESEKARRRRARLAISQIANGTER